MIHQQLRRAAGAVSSAGMAQSEGAQSHGAAIAKASFDVPVAAVAAGSGVGLLASAAFLVVVLRRRRKTSGADGAEVWALD